MNRHSSKSNMWINISTVKGKWESPHPNKEILCQIKVMALIMNF